MKKSSSVFSCNPSNKYPKLNRKIYSFFPPLLHRWLFGCVWSCEISLPRLDQWRLRLSWLILYLFIYLCLYYCTVRNGVRRTLLSNSASLSRLIDTKIRLVEKQRNHWDPLIPFSLSPPTPRGSGEGFSWSTTWREREREGGGSERGGPLSIRLSTYIYLSSIFFYISLPSPDSPPLPPSPPFPCSQGGLSVAG